MSPLDVKHASLDAGPTKRGISWVEVVAGALILMVVCVFGSAKAQYHPFYYCLTSVSFNSNLSYDPLGPSTQSADAQISRSYNCPGQKYGQLYANTTYWSDMSVTVSSISSTRGSVYNAYNVSRPNSLIGTGTASNVGFGGDYGYGGNINTVRFEMTKIGSVSPGLRSFPILLTHPSYSYYYEYTYNCGNRLIYKQCSSSDYSMYNYEERRNVPVNVPSAMALSMAGGSTTGTMDFANNLATDAKQSINLRLRSNTPYRVTMDSSHNGVLKLNNSPTATDQIAYSATLNGTSITEGAPFINTSPTGTGGADVTLPFEVTIGDTSTARAGFYKDVVTVTISANP
jgi:hypothetical protein